MRAIRIPLQLTQKARPWYVLLEKHVTYCHMGIVKSVRGTRWI